MKRLLFAVFGLLAIFIFYKVSAQEIIKFKSLTKYNIIAIYVNGQELCKNNGTFTYGTLDYGVYKNRSYYFAINNNNYIYEGLSLYETTTYDYINQNISQNNISGKVKSMASESEPSLYNFVFMDKNESGLSLFCITIQDVEIVYFLDRIN